MPIRVNYKNHCPLQCCVFYCIRKVLLQVGILGTIDSRSKLFLKSRMREKQQVQNEYCTLTWGIRVWYASLLYTLKCTSVFDRVLEIILSFLANRVMNGHVSISFHINARIPRSISLDLRYSSYSSTAFSVSLVSYCVFLFMIQESTLP